MKRRLVGIALLLTLLMALLAACGSTAAPQVVKETVVVEEVSVVKETVVVTEMVEKEVVVTPTAVPEAPRAPMKTDPKVLVMPSAGEPTRLDPDSWYDVVGWEPHRYVYESLLTYKGESTTEFEPKLAESWDISADGLVYTFHLRHGVKFHDGTDFNAEAVKFNFERRLGVDRGPAYMLFNVAETKVLDDYTVQVTLTKPLFNFLHFMASLWGPKMMSPTAVTANATTDDPWAQEWARDNAVGTGPFVIESWEKGQRMTLAKFDDYWGGWDHPHVDRIIIPIIPEMATQRLLLENGDLDLIPARMTFSELDAMAKTPGLVLDEYPSNFMGLITMNTQAEPLSNPKLREALAWAFDYETALNNVCLGHCLPSASMFPAGFEGYDQSPMPYKKDLDKARQLLEEAGYGDGLTLEMMYQTEEADMSRPLLQMYQADLASIGVNVILKEVPIAVLWDYYAPDSGIQMLQIHLAPDASDPFSWIYIAFHTQAGINWSFYSNPELDAAVEQAWATPKLEDRLPLWKTTGDFLIRDNPAIIPWQSKDSMVRWDYVKNIIHNQAYPRSIDLYRVYKEE